MIEFSRGLCIGYAMKGELKPFSAGMGPAQRPVGHRGRRKEGERSRKQEQTIRVPLHFPRVQPNYLLYTGGFHLDFI